MSAVCERDGCTGAIRARGLCGRHYQSARTAGLPTLPPKPLEERFWEKVDVSGECWEWTAVLNSVGYGRFYADGTMRLAHRFSYEHFVGPIPAGLQIDHLCRNKICVRPDHLEAVTQRVNILRSMAPSAVAARSDRCGRGHEFSEENTYRPPSRPTRRICNRCRREWATKRRALKRQVAS